MKQAQAMVELSSEEMLTICASNYLSVQMAHLVASHPTVLKVMSPEDRGLIIDAALKITEDGGSAMQETQSKIVRASYGLMTLKDL